ncbi:uncharacterized protein N7482_006335 [Penicillium canariense]|uniref:FAD-binding FR-type domain-containing protein n=1 Tax=Penicillium canariense TaxID=189055 RepID=A0A9W9I6G6_9EURO|nr:uncharacterized protein N7482_006335 [Penicillium canariense]KAJ5167554.1 hypothetical protein N7482_006335 [Penicillium canariense]
MRALRWLIIVLSAQSARSDVLPQDALCVTAVYSAYNYISFAGVPAKGMWDTRCQNPLKVTSIYAASEIYCSDGERTAGLAQLAAICREFGHHELLPRDVVAENLTEEAIHSMRTVDYLELSRADYAHTPVLLSASYFNRMFNTIDSWQFETWSHHAFGYMGYAYWGGICLLGILCRLCEWMFYRRQHQFGPSPESNIPPSTDIWYGLPLVRDACRWMQTYLITPAPIVGQGRYLLGFTFSSRVEALAVLGFWFLGIIFTVVGYRTFPGNIYWPDVKSQVLRYSADRTGIMSFANLPLLWLFSGRNNVLIWATGWSFPTFTIFHRHVARIATLQAVALFAITLVIVTSLDRIRVVSYEIFLVAHILFSVITLVGCFYTLHRLTPRSHTIVFEGHEYWQYLWPSILVWALDRCLRVIRLFYCNIHVKLSRRRLIHTTETRMAYDEAADVIRLEVTPGMQLLQPTPGSYYFLYQPFRFFGWENHPFTVGAWTYEVGSRETLLQVPGKPDESLDVSQLPLLSETVPEHERLNDTEPSSEGTESMILKLIFWVRPYHGWTQQLRRQCLRASNQPVHTTLLLEGPYGYSFPMWRYESVLMIMGGTGIASAIPYLQDHIRRCANGMDGISEETSQTRDIELVWTARQSAFLCDIAHRELRPLLSREDFHASFYTTRPSERSCADLDDLGYSVQMGRPHLQSLITSRACDASMAGIKLAILVCGPSGMADEARAATHRAMRQGYQSIKYVEESFTW